MNWQEIISQEQFPKDKYFLMYRPDLNYYCVMKYHYTSSLEMSDERKKEVYVFTEIDGNFHFFDENIKNTYTHFAIINPPTRSKREDLDMRECIFDHTPFKILGNNQKYCCFAGIPDEFKCNIDWLEEFVKSMKQKCIYCSKMRGDHLSKMRCSEHLC